MDAKKLLMGVATTAVGWMLGLWAYKSFMGSKTKMAAPAAPAAPAAAPADSALAEFGDDGYDY